MALKQESKVFILDQVTPEDRVKVIIKGEAIVEFRRLSNDAMLFVMTKDEVFELCKEVFPDALIAP